MSHWQSPNLTASRYVHNLESVNHEPRILDLAGCNDEILHYLNAQIDDAHRWVTLGYHQSSSKFKVKIQEKKPGRGAEKAPILL